MFLVLTISRQIAYHAYTIRIKIHFFLIAYGMGIKRISTTIVRNTITTIAFFIHTNGMETTYVFKYDEFQSFVMDFLLEMINNTNNDCITLDVTS